MPHIYGYGRVSTELQGLSLDTQKQQIEQYLKFRMQPGGDLAGHTYAGFHSDMASAVKLGFSERETGSWISAVLQPSDIIVTSHYDRMIRNNRTLTAFLDLLKEKEASWIAMDTNIDSSTPVGELVLQVLASVKNMEVQEMKRRFKDGLTRRKQMTGSPVHQFAGWVCHLNTVQPDIATRDIGNRMLDVIRENPWSFARPELMDLACKKWPNYREKCFSCKAQSAATQIRLAGRCVLGWPLMSSPEIIATYFLPINNRPNQRSNGVDRKAELVRKLDVYMCTNTWPYDHPAEELTKERLVALGEYSRQKKMAV